LYIARTGCQWRLLPNDVPPFTTVQGYFYDWRDQGLFERINFELLLQARKVPRQSGCERYCSERQNAPRSQP
jgi:transposase